MGTIGETLKDKYTNLVERREIDCVLNPTDIDVYEKYLTAVTMNDRVYGLYEFECDEIDYKEKRRTILR